MNWVAAERGNFLEEDRTVKSVGNQNDIISLLAPQRAVHMREIGTRRNQMAGRGNLFLLFKVQLIPYHQPVISLQRPPLLASS